MINIKKNKTNVTLCWSLYIINILFSVIFAPIVFARAFNTTGNFGGILADITNKDVSPLPSFGSGMILFLIFIILWTIVLASLIVVRYKGRSLNEVTKCRYIWVVVLYLLVIILYVFSVCAIRNIQLLTEVFETDAGNVDLKLNSTGICLFVLMFVPYALILIQIIFAILVQMKNKKNKPKKI
ncbi:MAG: hypothetical protein LBV22_00780 [Mycoplasmataceae bacterium]|nr:hypothetical protein [Mycoplasmataceae bacterium]